MFFADTYKGPRFRYGLRNRPAGGGGCPDGRIVGADSKERATRMYTHGTIEYSMPLPKRDIEGFELVPLGYVDRTGADTVTASGNLEVASYVNRLIDRAAEDHTEIFSFCQQESDGNLTVVLRDGRRFKVTVEEDES